MGGGIRIVFGLLAGFFFILAIAGKYHYLNFITMSQSLFFFISNVFMMLFQLRRWDPIFIVRYFLYIISLFLILAIPIVLLALVYFTYSRELKGKKSRLSKVSNIILLGLIVMFLLFTAYNIINIRAVYLPVLISLYSSLAIFLIVQYLSYLLLTLCVTNRRGKSDQASLIIVLGTEIDDEGQVQVDLKKRLDRAILAYSRLDKEVKEASYFLVTGGNPTQTGMTEAEGMQEYLMMQGIGSRQIIKEPSARNTEENIEFSLPFIRNVGKDKQVVIITNYYHTLRTRYFVERQGVKALYLSAKNPLISFPYATVREFLALILENRNWTVGMMIVVLLYEWLR